MTCTAQTLLAGSKALRSIPANLQGPVIIHLLQQIAGDTKTPNQLIAAAKALRAIPEGQQRQISNYLLCSINTQLGG